MPFDWPSSPFCGRSSPDHQSARTGEQVLDVERLRHIVGCPGAHQGNRLVDLAERGHEQEGRHLGVGGNLPEYVLAGDVRKADIADHQIWRRGLKSGNRLLTGAPPLDLVPGKLKTLIEGLPHDGIILDDCDRDRFMRHGGWLLSRSAGW
jgi:hypothetical protein